MALEPQKQPDLFIIRGDSVTINFTISGVDLTGATVFFTAKPELTDDAADSTAVIHVEVVSHTSPTTGVTAIELSPTDTNVEPGTYFYDIQVKKASGAIVSVPARKMKIWADVTRRTT